MKIFNSNNQCKNPDTKFIFEVGGGPGSHVDSGAETVKVTSTTGNTAQEGVTDAYDRIIGQVKPEELSQETKSKIFEQKIHFEATETLTQNEIDTNNNQIKSYRSEISTLSAEKQSLEETNDSEAESNIILGLMPNSHEEFINFIKTSRPSPEAIKDYLQSDALEDVSDEQVQAILPLATQMVAKLNQIDELARQIKEKESKIGNLEGLNRALEEKKKKNLDAATKSFQFIIDSNVPPEPSTDKDPSHSYLDRRSEIPEVAAEETGEIMDDHEIQGPTMVQFRESQMAEKDEEITASQERITTLLEESDLEENVQLKILERIQQLELNPEISKEDLVAFILAAPGLKGVVSPEELQELPYFKELQRKLQLIKEKNQLEDEKLELEKEELLQNLDNLVKQLKEHGFFSHVLSPETLQKVAEIGRKRENNEEIDLHETNTLISQIVHEVGTANLSENPNFSIYGRLELDAFRELQKSFGHTFERYGALYAGYETRQRRVQERIAKAEEARNAIRSELESYNNNPEKLAAAQAIAATKAFRETGTVSAPLAEFITNPDTDFSPENVQKVVNLMNSEAYINASPEEQSELFTRSVNMPASYTSTEYETRDFSAETSTFIGALPQGVGNTQVLPNGNIAFEAGGVDIEVDIANNKMFPRSADGRSRTWLSMEANPINTPAIQFFSAAMEASVDDKEDGFASIMRGGGQWKNEIFWRNLLAPTTGRSLQHKEIAGIKAIENTVGIQRLMTHLDLIDDSGNFVPGNATVKRDEFFRILISAANGSFESFAEKPAGTPLTELPE